MIEWNDKLKAKFTGLCARDSATIQVLILKFSFRSKTLLGLSENGPLKPKIHIKF